MDEQVQPKFSEEVERKAEELRKKAFLDESKYIDNESLNRAKELFKNLRAKEEQLIEEKLAHIENEKRKVEEELANLESEFTEKIQNIIYKKSMVRIETFQEQRRRAEEERKRLEELERQRAEEEEKRKQEEEARKLEEERKREEEEARRREEEVKRQKEEEKRRRLQEVQQRREEEERAKQTEKQERIKTLLTNAQKYFESGDYEHALVEVAKALVNDPNNSEALELDARIKNIQQEFAYSPETETKTKPTGPAVVKEKSIRPLVVPQKPSKVPMLIAIVISAVILLSLIIFQIRQSTVKEPLFFAVMPWTSESGNLEDNILGAALAEEVSRYYKSIAPPISLDYRTIERISHNAIDPTRVVFGLGIERVLIGGISKTGNNYTLYLKLVDSTGKTYWKQSYLRSWSGLFNLTADISKQVLNELNIKQEDLAGGFHHEHTNINPDAYFFYLRGIELFHRRTPESINNAYNLFLQASQQDPNFSDAMAAAGEALMYSFDENWIRGDSIIQRIQNFAQGSLTTNPKLDRGYILLGRIAAHQSKFTTALTYLDSAYILSPNNCDISFYRGLILFRMGKYDDGINEFKKALKLNPNDPDFLRIIACAHQFIGENQLSLNYHQKASSFTDDSIAYLTTSAIDLITISPELRLNLGARYIAATEQRIKKQASDYQSYYRLSRLRQLLGMADALSYLKQLETNLQSILSKNPKDAVVMATLGLTLTRQGQFSEAATLAKRAISLAPDNPEVLYKISQLYSLQMYSQRDKKLDENKKNEAVKYLQQAVNLNYRLSEITNADFFNLLERPEFHQVIEGKSKEKIK